MPSPSTPTSVWIGIEILHAESNYSAASKSSQAPGSCTQSISFQSKSTYGILKLLPPTERTKIIYWEECSNTPGTQQQGLTSLPKHNLLPPALPILLVQGLTRRKLWPQNGVLFPITNNIKIWTLGGINQWYCRGFETALNYSSGGSSNTQAVFSTLHTI